MTLRAPTLRAQGNFIGGAFAQPAAARSFALPSPADPEDVPFEAAFASNAAALADEVVHAAQRAFSSYRKTSLDERREWLKAYQKALEARKEALAIAIARSIGKPLWEARTEVAAMIAKVDITLSSGMDLLAFPAEHPCQNQTHWRVFGARALQLPGAPRERALCASTRARQHCDLQAQRKIR
jgi:acyl-CoA reductase-like NAD-dependent aldehyde dehydrogenase